MIRTLNLDRADAADLLRNAEGQPFAVSTIQDFSRGKTRVPDDVWRQLSDLFEAVEGAADDIIADKGEADGGEGLLQHNVEVSAIALGHPALRVCVVPEVEIRQIDPDGRSMSNINTPSDVEQARSVCGPGTGSGS